MTLFHFGAAARAAARCASDTWAGVQVAELGHKVRGCSPQLLFVAGHVSLSGCVMHAAVCVECWQGR